MIICFSLYVRIFWNLPIVKNNNNNPSRQFSFFSSTDLLVLRQFPSLLLNWETTFFLLSRLLLSSSLHLHFFLRPPLSFIVFLLSTTFFKSSLFSDLFLLRFSIRKRTVLVSTSRQRVKDGILPSVRFSFLSSTVIADGSSNGLEFGHYQQRCYNKIDSFFYLSSSWTQPLFYIETEQGSLFWGPLFHLFLKWN